jgi:hypothetical protein
MTFTRCTFEDCLLVGTRFDECEFHDCRFTNCNTHKISLRDVYIDPRAFQFGKQYRRNFSNIGAHLFQQLFQNATQAHQTRFAAIADVERRRWFRKQILWQLKTPDSLKHSTWSKKTSTWAKIWTDVLFDWTAKYGYGPARFLISSGAFFCLVGIVARNTWAQFGMTRDGSSIVVTDYSQALYYSMQLATTLGFSDLRPTTGLGWSFSIGCALLGIAWAGLFTSILVRRVIR